MPIKSLSFERGFSLLEIMIALVIVAILAVIVYPTYLNSVTKSHRAEGQSALVDLQARMERIYVDYHDYQYACITPNGGACDPSASPPEIKVLDSNLTENGYYLLQITAATKTSYTISAIPQAAQATNDTLCGTLTITSAGVKGESGTATDWRDCW